MSKIKDILIGINESDSEGSEDSYYSVPNQMTRVDEFETVLNKVLNYRDFYSNVYPKLDTKNKGFVSYLIPLVRNIMLEVSNYMHELEKDSSSIDADYRKAVIGEILDHVNQFKKSNK